MSLREKVTKRFLELTERGAQNKGDDLMLSFLEMLEKVYEKAVTRRRHAYAAGIKKETSFDATVISLGNITVGGTGKTPMAVFLTKEIRRMGYTVAVLSSGYRSHAEKTGAIVSDGNNVLLTPAEAGDEAVLLARSLPGVPVLSGRRRTETGHIAVDEFHPDVILMDDAFQHWQVKRELDIVLINAANPVGNGHLLPRGILREPLDELERAGLFIITKADEADRDEVEKIYSLLRYYNESAPIAEAEHQPKWCVPYAQWLKGETSAEGLEEDSKVVALSALGSPDSFEETLEEAEYEVVRSLRFDDHHVYTERDLREASSLATAQRAVVVTTEKDAVKLSPSMVESMSVPLYVLGIEIEITAGEEEVKRVLKRVLGG